MRKHPIGALASALLLVVAASACSERANVTSPDASALMLTIVSGNNQSGAVGAELPNALVAQVTDSFGTPVAGRVVTFHVVAGGGSVFSGAAISDANGRVRERWTLGPRPGETQTLEVRGVDPGGKDVVYGSFSATAKMPLGYNRLWVGGGSLAGDPQDWAVAGNWYPEKVPVDTDQVLVPSFAREMPVMHGVNTLRNVRRLTVQNGASIVIGRAGESPALQTFGTVVVNGVIAGVGRTIASGGTLRGNFGWLFLGATSLGGPVVADSVVSGAGFDIAGKHMVVNGNYLIYPRGLTMTAAGDTIEVMGSLGADSMPGATAGALRVRGDIGGFPAASGIGVIAAGNNDQAIGSAYATIKFTDLVIRKDSGVATVSTNLNAANALRLEKGDLSVAGSVTAVTKDLYLGAGTTLVNSGTLYYSGTYTNAGATIVGNAPQFTGARPRVP